MKKVDYFILLQSKREKKILGRDVNKERNCARLKLRGSSDNTADCGGVEK